MIPTGISVNGFADDHSLQKSCLPGTKSEIETVELLDTSMTEVDYWMKENRLNLILIKQNLSSLDIKLNWKKVKWKTLTHVTQLRPNLKLCSTWVPGLIHR